MAKAILVMDMPSSCLDCPCSKFNPNIKTECRWQCEANGMELTEIDLDIERPTMCPLREVKEGEWIFKYEGTYNSRRAYCSVCGKRSGIGGIKENQMKPYCPNCGAEMKVDEILGGGD